MEVAPLSGGENPGGVAHKHPPGHRHSHCDNFDNDDDDDDCDNGDNGDLGDLDDLGDHGDHGETPGGVAHKHPAGDHHHGHDCDRGDHHGDCDDCDNFDNIPINSDEGGEEVGQKGDAEGVGRSEGAVLPFQSLEVQTDKGPQTEPPF